MGKSKQNKRKKRSSTDDDENNSSLFTNGGPSSDSVSDILSQTNSALYGTAFDRNSSETNGDIDMAESSVSSEKKMDIMFQIVQKIEGKLEKIDKKLSTLSVLEKKVDSFDKDLKKLWTLVYDSNKKFEESLLDIGSRVEHLEFLDTKYQSQVQDLEKQNSQMKADITYLKSQSMRNNLIIGGIDEEPGEKPTDTERKVRDFLVSKLKIAAEIAESMKIDRAHRMGSSSNHRPSQRSRSIVCRFTEFKDRDTVLRSRFELKGSHYYVTEQFPPEVVERRRRLVPRLKAAKHDGKRAWLSYDTLYIDGRPVSD